MTYTSGVTRTEPDRPRVPWPWAGLALLTIAFLAFSLPPYLTLDPTQSRLPAPQGYPWYYAGLVVHIFFGSVALLTACVQLWPWLRAHHPVAHRWSGRVYVFAGAVPASIVVLTITPLGVWGANQRIANTLLALLWLATTVAGYRAARGRRFTEHREWMVRSTALAFSIVANRLWSFACIVALAPDAIGPDGTLAATPEVAQAIGASTWLSWVVNLLVAEWWPHRTRHRAATRTDYSPSRSSTSNATPGSATGAIDSPRTALRTTR